MVFNYFMCKKMILPLYLHLIIKLVVGQIVSERFSRRFMQYKVNLNIRAISHKLKSVHAINLYK